MATRTLSTRIIVPRSPEEVFAFFADAANLERLTPDWLNFSIRTPLPIEMRAGTIIDYRLRLRGIPIRWRTLISAWEPPFRFVDEQVRGPYRLWRHEHTFEPTPAGTLCRDRVEYRHLGGPLAERLIVRPDLDRIFAYRSRIIGRTLGERPSEPTAAGAVAASGD